ncbi:hypothetical protein [Pseudoflavonifractor phocaeensis]|uniref:hypothetical protein n=1 Tax=Pseudoflavonifractor phocaeensis TaxID=1870988 RepID=UPI00195B51AC|nr:hypothetical protein [Pseudoflavonifractor phocaeensis]MBM6871887.1 hypothetical protein [Pseudoflavonifractor phocaeensis]
MSAGLLDELRLLSERIKDEEMTIAVKEAAQLFLSGEDGTGGEGLSQEKVRYGKSACLLLRALRICLCLKLMEQGDRSCAALFRKDWETVLTNLAFLEYTLKVSGEILSDAVDLILLLAPEQRNHLIQQLSFKERLCIKKRNPLRFELHPIC